MEQIRKYVSEWDQLKQGLRLILVGFGVVGQSIAKMLSIRGTELRRLYGLNPKIVAAADRVGASVNPKGMDPRQLIELKVRNGTVSSPGWAGVEVTKLIQQVEAEVVVETTDTNLVDGQPGLRHIEAALSSHRHVVTTNKGPLALALPSLVELADYNGVLIRFSGTVGGGTPILELGKRGLLADRIEQIEGVLNGTCNFILTKMQEEGLSFQEALSMAQRKGYAEGDPSLDVDGWDSACKVVIMANWLLNRRATLADVKVEGIRDISIELVRESAKRGRPIRLLGSVGKDLWVAPVELPYNDPLCVRDNLNAVRFRTEFAGEEVIIGRGAGGLETASAVIRDLLEIKLSGPR